MTLKAELKKAEKKLKRMEKKAKRVSRRRPTGCGEPGREREEFSRLRPAERDYGAPRSSECSVQTEEINKWRKKNNLKIANFG